LPRRRPGKAKRIGRRLWTARLRKRTVAYVIRGGAVHTVAIAGKRAARSRASLRNYLRRIPRDGVTPRPASVDSPASTRIAPEKAVPLAEQRGAPSSRSCADFRAASLPAPTLADAAARTAP
jgi:hypothetical protein